MFPQCFDSIVYRNTSLCSVLGLLIIPKFILMSPDITITSMIISIVSLLFVIPTRYYYITDILLVIDFVINSYFIFSSQDVTFLYYILFLTEIPLVLNVFNFKSKLDVDIKTIVTFLLFWGMLFHHEVDGCLFAASISLFLSLNFFKSRDVFLCIKKSEEEVEEEEEAIDDSDIDLGEEDSDDENYETFSDSE